MDWIRKSVSEEERSHHHQHQQTQSAEKVKNEFMLTLQSDNDNAYL